MWRLTVLVLAATASAQIPSLGWCPDFQSMANFNMNRFLGTWYEAERFFTVSELGSRCVTTNYVSTPEGRIIVSNEIVNSLTGMKRLMEGSLQMIGREGEGRFMIKYSSLPLPYESEFSILDTDYDNYAVMWSCSGIGPVHTQNTWLLTRERLPSLMAMQNAYAVLDRFKISRTFFVKTNQADCTILPDPVAIPIEAKSADVIKNVDIKVKEKEPVEDSDSVKKQIIDEVVQERSAVPEISFEPKPVPVPEMILTENEKKGENMEEPKAEDKAEAVEPKAVETTTI
ncbi:32 kDa apolipoprotein precursor [Bombyx mori]|uniref:32 kDa apolipoprotein n=1 Tax=Bombyx mori TaxID=7091 RepID=B9VTR5_BOMMO|nr:32 kDa apolipoprotein precursor [Bombyx mori]ACM24341.1 32 kDa apolipoprotein [Bombyx mori]